MKGSELRRGQQSKIIFPSLFTQPLSTTARARPLVSDRVHILRAESVHGMASRGPWAPTKPFLAT